MPAPAPRVHARILGPARVTVDGAEAPAELLWRKHLARLVYLARSPRRARTREHLIGLLWSDRDEKQARHSLSEALRVFRRVLGDAEVQADVDQVRLGTGALALDCDEFAERRARGDWLGAAALVEGAFLEGLSVPGANAFEDWLAAERAAWRAQGVEALVKRSELELTDGDPVTAAATAQQARALDPVSEAAARAAMRALALAGERGAALRAAEELTQVLAAELGAKPEPETERLAARIREARVGRRVPAAPAGVRPRPPLVGRGAELAALIAAWERARAGRGQVVLIEGEPGEGKTRLVDELLARARLEEATIAAARAVPADREKSWSAVPGLLAGGLAEAPGLAGAAAAALAGLAVLDPDLAIRFGTAEPAAAPLPPSEALGAAVRAAAGERPVLVALDDAQWLDDASLGALPSLARDLAGHRVLVVLAVAAGSDPASRLDDLRARIGRDLDGAALRLRRLDTSALDQLVIWGLPRYAAGERDRLVRRLEQDTAGIPLLAVAMVEAVAEGFRLASDAPAWPSPQRTLIDTLPGNLPAAVLGAVCLQYRELPAEAQQVLAAAAAWGDRVTVAPLARATGLERGVVETALDRLEWSRWLAADARGYAFAAPIAREILLREMITPGQVRRYRQNYGA
jgi:DNA-binding SARP family transcriptional activator